MTDLPSVRACGYLILCCTFLTLLSCQSNQRSIAYESKSKNTPSYRAGNKSKSKSKSKQKRKTKGQLSQRTKENKQRNKKTHRPVQQRPTASDEYPSSQYVNCNSSLSYLVQAASCSRESLCIKIDKSEYKLSVYSYGELVKEYPVVFGKNPKGDKLMQGDKRTPEGFFKVRAYYPHDEWEKFVWINYPTQECYKKHNQAKAQGKIPSSASIGGSIGIHGVPDDKNYAITERQNWTLGCIAMKNQDINELYPFVRKDMAISIND